MNKKVIIQIVVIVGAFAAAGFVLFNGLNNNRTTAPSSAGTVSEKDDTKILPHGETLNFKSDLFKQGFQFDTISYPKVESSEVGTPGSSLINSPPVQK